MRGLSEQSFALIDSIFTSFNALDFRDKIKVISFTWDKYLEIG